MQIFLDPDCSQEIERVLWEGKTYYLLFPTIDPSTIKVELANAGITDFVSWNKRNPVATLRIVNRIGLLQIFSKEFDVRSEKFLENESGTRQFQIILDDLARLSRHLLFASSPSLTARRNSMSRQLQPSLLERFNYYRQACLKSDQKQGLAALVEQIIRSPHSRLVEEHIQDSIWNAKKPSRQTLRSVIQPGQTYARLPLSHPLAQGRPGLAIAGTNEALFPLKALRSRGSITSDTAENRFIKHVLLDVEGVCRAVIGQNLLSGSLLDQCHRLLETSRSLLRLPFFQEISRLNTIPFSSPALTTRHGYRDLYRMFMRSRMGAKHLFDEFTADEFKIELKDVSLLYEYWVFYKIADALLRPGAVYTSRSAMVKDGRIVNSASVSDGKWAVHFNKTFSRSEAGSYSLRLRPDVVIERVANEDASASIYVLDAKYKTIQNTYEDEDDDALLKVIGDVKPSDIHKMHTYIDAIANVRSALAVYPGHRFAFYSRDRQEAPSSEPSDIKLLCGVGAIPLMPGADNQHFFEFLSRLN